MLVAIPGHMVESLWLEVAPILQRAIDRSQGDYSAEDILFHLKEKNMQLWAWAENHKIETCCVTQIVVFPNKKVCQLLFVAGQSMKKWLECDEAIISWAKAQGCSQLECFCRDGWLRVLQPRNWFKVWSMMRRDI